MSTLAEFLHGLFSEGRIVLKGRPLPTESDRASALAVLAAEFERHRLDVAGEPIAFDPATALMAGELLRQASWFLVSRSEPVEVMERSLPKPPGPKSASQHLSADAVFRFLPPLLRRARSISPGDWLSIFLADLLRAWPLSGVLSDLPDGPVDVGGLGNHPGLWLLYAERLAIDEKPGWMVQGPARGHVELVFDGLGKGSSPLLVPHRVGGWTLSDETVEKLQRDVVADLKRKFVGRDEVVDLIALAVVAGEHLFLYGPPGTAKSALIRQFASSVQGRYFEYLLTRFSEPNEIFGPIDLARLREGAVATVTTGMLPEAEFAFLDELFNANSAILNNLLTVLNERVYRRGAEVHRLPLLSLFSASNHLAEDEALGALFDRFLLRCHVDHLKRDAMPRLLAAGWALERPAPLTASVSASDLRALSRKVHDVDLSAVTELYSEVVFKVRDLGIAISDRRAVKMLKLLAASALLSGREAAIASDLWVLRYVWDRVEQIDPLASLVNGVLERHQDEPGAHPLASVPEAVDPEELARQLDAIEATIGGGSTSLAALARIREQIAGLSDRAAWVAEEKPRKHLLERVSRLLAKVGA